jgi:hypothetical protein
LVCAVGLKHKVFLVFGILSIFFFYQKSARCTTTQNPISYEVIEGCRDE